MVLRVEECSTVNSGSVYELAWCFQSPESIYTWLRHCVSPQPRVFIFQKCLAHLIKESVTCVSTCRSDWFTSRLLIYRPAPLTLINTFYMLFLFLFLAHCVSSRQISVPMRLCCTLRLIEVSAESLCFSCSSLVDQTPCSSPTNTETHLHEWRRAEDTHSYSTCSQSERTHITHSLIMHIFSHSTHSHIAHTLLLYTITYSAYTLHTLI